MAFYKGTMTTDELGFEMTVRYRLLAVRVDDHFRSGVLIDARTLGAL